MPASAALPPPPLRCLVRSATTQRWHITAAPCHCGRAPTTWRTALSTYRLRGATSVRQVCRDRTSKKGGRRGGGGDGSSLARRRRRRRRRGDRNRIRYKLSRRNTPCFPAVSSRPKALTLPSRSLVRTCLHRARNASPPAERVPQRTRAVAPHPRGLSTILYMYVALSFPGYKGMPASCSSIAASSR
jgi:hypothetical protein